jgi:hypothetical protein
MRRFEKCERVVNQYHSSSRYVDLDLYFLNDYFVVAPNISFHFQFSWFNVLNINETGKMFKFKIYKNFGQFGIYQFMISIFLLITIFPFELPFITIITKPFYIIIFITLTFCFTSHFHT